MFVSGKTISTYMAALEVDPPKLHRLSNIDHAIRDAHLLLKGLADIRPQSEEVLDVPDFL